MLLISGVTGRGRVHETESDRSYAPFLLERAEKSGTGGRPTCLAIKKSVWESWGGNMLLGSGIRAHARDRLADFQNLTSHARPAREVEYIFVFFAMPALLRISKAGP